jgi:hypothetical protein
MNLLVSAFAFSPLAMLGIVLLPTAYLGYVILKTRDSVRAPSRLHPVDLWMCRNSGMLAATLAAALLAGVGILDAMRFEPQDIGLGSSLGLSLLGFVMEVGAVLCVACLYAPPNVRHVRPTILWRVTAVPLLFIYGAFVVLQLMNPIATMLHAQR